jgi:hypothetical protein
MTLSVDEEIFRENTSPCATSSKHISQGVTWVQTHKQLLVPCPDLNAQTHLPSSQRNFLYDIQNFTHNPTEQFSRRV